jgi:hypothetical protein
MRSMRSHFRDGDDPAAYAAHLRTTETLLAATYPAAPDETVPTRTGTPPSL